MIKKLLIMSMVYGACIFSNAQMTYNKVAEAKFAPFINNASPRFLTSGGVYDISTGLWPYETLGEEPNLIAIAKNSSGNYTILGETTENYIGRATYSMDNGKSWTEVPAPTNINTMDMHPFDISPNGNSIIGGLLGVRNASPIVASYRYNIPNKTFSLLEVPNTTGTMLCDINDQDIMVGRVDDISTQVGTIRRPLIYNYTTGTYKILDMGLDEYISWENGLNKINNNNIAVGTKNNKGIIYDYNADKLTYFQFPFPAFRTDFNDISADNNIVIGSIAMAINVQDAIIYSSSIAKGPILLSDVLSTHGVTGLPDVLYGAYTLSGDGNIVAGGNMNGYTPTYYANLNNSLIPNGGCQFDCPSNIEVTLSPGEINKQVSYTVSGSCNSNSSMQVSRVAGLPSGSNFPVGNTLIYHTAQNTTTGVKEAKCYFYVTVRDNYCSPTIGGLTYPISKVSFADLSNTSSNNISPINQYEYFLDKQAHMIPGNSYTIDVTVNGQQSLMVFAYIDWNQDQVFDETTEKYYLGLTKATFVSDSENNLSLEINVPQDAKLGNTRMRVISQFSPQQPQPDIFKVCTDTDGLVPGEIFPYLPGQVENYTVVLSSSLATTEDVSISRNLAVYPNPTTEQLHLQSKDPVVSYSIYATNGQMMKTDNVKYVDFIDVKTLPIGLYIIQAKTDKGQVFTTKFLKK